MIWRAGKPIRGFYDTLFLPNISTKYMSYYGPVHTVDEIRRCHDFLLPCRVQYKSYAEFSQSVSRA